MNSEPLFNKFSPKVRILMKNLDYEGLTVWEELEAAVGLMLRNHRHLENYSHVMDTVMSILMLVEEQRKKQND